MRCRRRCRCFGAQRGRLRTRGTRCGQARQCRAGDLGNTLKEIGRHVFLVALRVGRGQHQHAEGRRTRLACRAQRQQRQRGRLRGLVQPLHCLHAHVHAAVRCAERGGKVARVGAHAGGKGLPGKFGRHAPDAQRRLRHHEHVAHVIADLAWQRVQVVLQVQAGGPLEQAVGCHAVVAAMADHFHQAVLQHLDLVAQHLGLALVQADHALAMGTAQLHGRQQLGIALEETGVLDQEFGDIAFGNGGKLVGVHAATLETSGSQGCSGRSISPW